MNLDERKRLIEEKKKPVNESIDNTNAYIEAHSSGGIPVHNPEYLKKRLEESREDLFNATNTDLPWLSGVEASQKIWDVLRILKQVEYLLNKAHEAYWQLCYEIGEIPPSSKIVQENLDNHITPPNWKEKQHYTFGNRILRNGRIQMCVKEHDGNEEFLDNPRYWRDMVAKLSVLDKKLEDEYRLKVSKLVQKDEKHDVSELNIVKTERLYLIKEFTLLKIGDWECFRQGWEWIKAWWKGVGGK